MLEALDVFNPKFEKDRIFAISWLSFEMTKPPSPVENPFVACVETTEANSQGVTVSNAAAHSNTILVPVCFA